MRRVPGAGVVASCQSFKPVRKPASSLFATALLMFATSASAEMAGEPVDAATDAATPVSQSSSSIAGGQSNTGTDEAVTQQSEAVPQELVEKTIPVNPQDAADKPEEPAHRGSRVGMEEVIVTAQKREENIQDVPISIQAFSAAELDAKGITDPSKLVTVTPGLVYDAVAGFAVIYIRGVGTDAFIPSADLSVATYVDGVYFPFAYALARSFGTVERVEVLKGPQGTLFGRNSTGGAISIVTKDPSQSFEGSAGASYGNFDDLQSRAYLNVPVLDSLAVSLAVIYNHKEDYYKLAADSPQQGLQAYQDKGANIKIKWAPFDDFDAVLSSYYYSGRGVATSLAVNLDPSPVLGKAILGLPEEPNDYEAGSNVSGAYSTLYADSLTLKLSTSALDFKSISAYQDFTANSIFDFDGTSKDVVSFGTKYGKNSPYGKNITARVFTQELQLISNKDSWGSDWLNYVGGVYYINSTAGFDPVEFYVGGLENLLSGGSLSLLGNAATAPLLSTVQGLLSRANAPAVGSAILLSGLLDTEATAVYLQGTAKLIDGLSLTLGGRYQDERRRVYKADLGVAVNPPNGQVTPNLISYPDDSLHESNFSPRAVLDYQWADDVMTYLSYSQGFKSGSFNIINLTKPPTRIKSEKVTSYELGLKSDWFNHRLRLNGAIFRNEIHDLQVQFLSLLSGGVVQFENAKKAHIDGAELGGSFAITDNLIFGFAATYLESRYDDYPDAEGFSPQTGLLQQHNDYTGNTIARTPKFTGSADLNYYLQIPGGSLELGGSYYYNDGYFFSAQNTIAQPSYSQLGAQISYLYERENLRITAFGDNLTDDKHYLYKFATDFGTLGKLAPPRTYGLRLAWNF